MDLHTDTKSVFMQSLAERIEGEAYARAKEQSALLNKLLEPFADSMSFAVKGILRDAAYKVERVLAQEYAVAEAKALAGRLIAVEPGGGDGQARS